MFRHFNRQSFCAVVVILALALTTGCVTDSSDAGSGSPATITLPTPIQDGLWNNLTVEQARALALFPLLVPDPMPESLEIINIMVATAPPSGVQGTTNYAEVHIASPGGTSKIVLTETTRETHLNAGPSATHSTLDINGITIDKVADPRGGGKETLSYSWVNDGLWYSLVAPMPMADVTEAQLERVIENLKRE